MAAHKEISDIRILVIGDIILDEYIYGEVTRISPEAPVPIVKETKREYKLGGAANVAANIASIGVNVDLIGQTGGKSDKDTNMLTTLCRGYNIHEHFYENLKETIKKTRVIANNQQVVRIDTETLQDFEDFSGTLQEKEYDCIVVSDYAKGTITEAVMNTLKETGSRIIVDPKPSNCHLYEGVFLMTPNELEATSLVGGGIKEVPEISVKSISKSWECSTLLTLGSQGMVLYNRETHQTTRLKTVAQEVFDVTGAGDTVVGVLAVVISLGFGLELACRVANGAAAITVSHHGTSTITYTDFKKQLILECTQKG